MERKLIRIGSSLAVTPSEVVKEFRLKKGQRVDVSVHPRTGAVTIRPGVRYFAAGKVTREFREIAEHIINRRDAVFRKLARH